MMIMMHHQQQQAAAAAAAAAGNGGSHPGTPGMMHQRHTNSTDGGGMAQGGGGGNSPHTPSMGTPVQHMQLARATPSSAGPHELDRPPSSSMQDSAANGGGDLKLNNDGTNA
jgi:hypothetical protein